METDQLIATDKFCTFYNVKYSFVESLMEIGLIEVVNQSGGQFISITHLHKIERILRLHDDLNINLEGIEAIHTLLNRIDQMNSEIISLQNRLRFYEKFN